MGIGSFGGPGGEGEEDDTETRNVNPGINCEGKSLFERVNEETQLIFTYAVTKNGETRSSF